MSDKKKIHIPLEIAVAWSIVGITILFLTGLLSMDNYTLTIPFLSIAMYGVLFFNKRRQKDYKTI